MKLTRRSLAGLGALLAIPSTAKANEPKRKTEYHQNLVIHWRGATLEDFKHT